MKDLTSEIAPLIDVTPLLRNGNAAVNGATGGGDIQGYNGAVVEFVMGARTDSSVACKLQHDDASNFGTAADVPDAQTIGGSGGTNAQTLNTTNTRARIGYIGTKRYVRGVMTQSGATTGATYGSELIRGFAIKQPTGTP